MKNYFSVFWSLCLFYLFFFAKKHVFFAKIVNKMDLILHIFTLSGLLTSLTLGQTKWTAFQI